MAIKHHSTSRPLSTDWGGPETNGHWVEPTEKTNFDGYKNGMDNLELLKYQVKEVRSEAQKWWQLTMTNILQKTHYVVNKVSSSLADRSDVQGNHHLRNNSNQKKLAHYAWQSPTIFVLVSLSLTGTIGQRFYHQPKLDVGTIAPQTIRSPENASIIDHKTTEDKRRDARIGAIATLKPNEEIEQQIYQNLGRSLKQGDELRQIAGPFPFMSTSILSTPTQKYLRQIDAAKWQALKNYLQIQASSSTPANDDNDSVLMQARQELQAIKQKQGISELFLALENVAKAREKYNDAQNELVKLSLSEIGTLYDHSIFDLSDQTWQATQRAIKQITTRMLKQGIPQGLSSEFWQQAIQFQVEEFVQPEGQKIAIATLYKVLEPNLIKDDEATKTQSELVAQKVKPVVVEIKQGEIIVKQGDTITQADFVLLDHFGLSARQINWFGLLAFFSLVSGAVALVFIVKRIFNPSLRRRDMLLLWLLSITTPLLVALGLPLTSLPAVGLLVASFYGSAMAVTVVGLLALILPIGLNIEIMHLIASAAGGLVGGLMASRLRSREELAMLGSIVGLTQGLVYLLIMLILSANASIIWWTALGVVALQGLAGLAWSIVALGLSPYLEHLFDLITPIRLSELASPNCPLLKNLAAEAPGTFQHTIFVASLAEAAARNLGCNVELVRTGTLYHDIGKMHDPLAFIENQMGGPNKHDEINNPWVSADLIKKHVSEGLAMAKKYRLPKAIQAFIPEHQGTMLIAYFYHQAKQIQVNEQKELAENQDNVAVLTQAREVLESDFRYEGPIPQSRETGILMLADSSEAALRSLEDATHAEALNMVNKILRSRWQDHQLDESGLTRADLDIIAETFVRVWEQFHHKRIAYPKGVLSAR